MAIVKFGLRHETGPSEDKDGMRTWMRVYRVTTDGRTDGVGIRLDRRCPRILQQHPKDTAARAINVHPERVPKSRRHWDVTVQYSTEAGRRQAANPLARPAVITGEYAEWKRQAWKDRKGKLIATTAGEPIPMQVDDADLILNIEKNIPAFLPNWLDRYPNATNADAVRIRGRTFPKRKLKLKGMRFGDIEIAQVGPQSIEYIILSFQLHYRRIGWDREFLNQGHYERWTYFNRQEKKDITDLRPITAGAGKPQPSGPLPLDEQGRAFRNFATGDLITPKPKELVFLNFELDDELPFSLLPLK